jgi:hypothetical protein
MERVGAHFHPCGWAEDPLRIGYVKVFTGAGCAASYASIAGAC